jgi:hypothetical protein
LRAAVALITCPAVTHVATPPTLYYRRERPGARTANVVNLALALYPLLVLVSLHLLYVVEWINNGEPPIPPHHGPANEVENVLYWSTTLLIVGAVPVFLGHVVMIAWFMRDWPFEVAGTTPRAARLQLLLGVAAWVVGFILFFADPVGALNFFMD